MPPLYINDDNYTMLLPDSNGHYDDNGTLRICNAIPPQASPGDIPHAPPFEIDPIPRSEWDDRIAQHDRDHTWLEDYVRGIIPCTDQDGLGYCHAYGTVMAGMIARLKQGHPFIMLSSESVGGPVTNWRNNGADPADDMLQMAQYGACPQAWMDKPWSLKPSRWQDGWEQEALKYRATEWADVRVVGPAFDAAVTMALLGIPCGIGYMWWSHYVSGPYRVVKNGRKYAVRIRNNWGADWGDDGFADFEEGKGTPDWNFAATQMTPTG